MKKEDIPRNDRTRFGIAPDIELQSQEEKTNHVHIMTTAAKLLYYGSYLSKEEFDGIQSRINEVVKKYKIRVNKKDQNKIRIISLPFE